MNLQFVNVWLLSLMWLAPLLAFWWVTARRRRERSLERFMAATMRHKLQPASARARFSWQTGLTLTALSLMILAAARPQWGMREVTVFQRGRDVVIALDVSRSMLANDVHPNRLQRAKTDIMDLIKELKGDRAALLAFRFKGALLCPLTTDYAFLKQALDGAGIDSAPRGETNIGDAILKALQAFENDQGAHKAIVLISDGEDFTGKAVEAAEEARKRNIPVFTVGLGSQKGARIPDQNNRRSFVSYRGKDVVSKLDNKTLDAIARTSGGAYIPIGTSSTTSLTLGTLYRNHLRNIDAQDLEEKLLRRRVERYQIFLFPAVLCLLAAMFLSRGRLSIGAEKLAGVSEPRRRLAGASEPRRRLPEPTPSVPAPEPPKPKPLKDLSPPPRELKNLAILLLLLFPFMALTALAQTNEPAPSPAAANAPAPSASATNALPASRPATAGSPPRSGGVSTPLRLRSDTPPGRKGARQAQRLYALGKYEEAAKAYLDAAAGSTRSSQRDFRTNAAVALFKAGKYQEAADEFRGLSETAESGDPNCYLGLGSALYKASADISPEKADATNLTERAELLKGAAEAFRNAARNERAGEAAHHDLAVALRDLPELQEQAHIAQLLSKYEKSQPAQIAFEMLTNQRDVIEGLSTILTNDSPALITAMEDLAEKQKANADLWIPLKGKLLQAMSQSQDTNVQQQVAGMQQQIEATRSQMMDAASALRDIDSSGRNSAAGAEAVVYYLWKAIAPYAQILQEDIRLQTNIITRTESVKEPDEPLRGLLTALQDEAGQLTRLFTERFSRRVPEQNAAPPENVTPPNAPAGPDAGNPPTQPAQITPEVRKKILDLAARASAAQTSASALMKDNYPQASAEKQHESHDLLKEIEDLLPKEKPQPQEQEQKQQSKEQKPDEQTAQESKPEQQPEAKPEKPEEKEDATPEDVKKLLEKALQREKEHEAEKKRRLQSIPMSPHERDW